MDKNLDNLQINITQTYIRHKNELNCKRHKKVFNNHDAIPEYCFGCYKIQIEPDNVIDLIRLYILFKNINLKNNNLRKSTKLINIGRKQVDFKLTKSKWDDFSKSINKNNRSKFLKLFFNPWAKRKLASIPEPRFADHVLGAMVMSNELSDKTSCNKES